MATILKDPGGGLWQLDVTDDQLLTTTSIASGAYSAPVITDATLTQAYTLGVASDGSLTLDIAALPSITSCLDLIAPLGAAYDLMVDSQARLILIPTVTTSFIVGVLYPQNEAYPRPSQPGGAGTPVTSPTQTTDEKTGRFVAGCGHFFNSWEIISGSICSYPSALICCPTCRWIQRVLRPYSLIHTLPFEYIQG